MRPIIANIAAAACGALTLMLLLVQPRLIQVDPRGAIVHGAIVDHQVGRYQDLPNVEVRAAR